MTNANSNVHENLTRFSYHLPSMLSSHVLSSATQIKRMIQCRRCNSEASSVETQRDLKSNVPVWLLTNQRPSLSLELQASLPFMLLTG
uniref:Uncharacterized protein n=1 Tax=Helianthus annuus TaxID=4232 RepID=A0A251USU8_HELAN